MPRKKKTEETPVSAQNEAGEKSSAEEKKRDSMQEMRFLHLSNGISVHYCPQGPARLTVVKKWEHKIVDYRVIENPTYELAHYRMNEESFMRMRNYAKPFVLRWEHSGGWGADNSVEYALEFGPDSQRECSAYIQRMWECFEALP